MDSLYLAWRYLCFYKVRSFILIGCITVIAALPLALEILVNESERQLSLRAESTPLLIGAKGSALDLVMNSLYFSDASPEPITMAAVDQILESDLASPIPLLIRYRTRTFPIVGTTLDYLDFRQLEIKSGNPFSLLGQCLVGAEIARQLDLGPGDHLTSSPEAMFDIAGVYPLKMRISGVLAETNSADDRAVFVDIRTAWIISGLGHGHTDLAKSTDESVILKREAGQVTANAKLMQYNEITEDNIDRFHLHGDPATFPITAVLALPHDEKSATILQGRYLDQDSNYQIVTPAKVVDSLLANIFRIRNVLDAVILMVGTATLMALVLVFSLSLRLRSKEMETIFKIGSSRATISRLLGAEITIIGCLCGLLCLIIMLLLNHYDEELVRRLFI
jgi:putative ABC transport system permease protein